MLFALQLWADQPQRPDPMQGLFDVIVPTLGLFFLVYLFFLRPMARRQQQERDALYSGLEKNDRVLTTAGIYGTIVSVSDKEDEITVKVDDNVKLKMLRASISRNLTKEEKVKAAQAEKQAGS